MTGRFLRPLLGDNRLAGVLLLLLAVTPVGASALEGMIVIYSGDARKEYLGCLNCSQAQGYSSVWNDFGPYGFNSYSGVWKALGPYANSVSSLSMCNELATDPPVIMDILGRQYGRLSISETYSRSVCSSTGDTALCRMVRSVCKSKSF